MMTKKVYISIPYVTPALEIDCDKSNVTSYLEHLFFPYVKYDPQRNDYFKISFIDCNDGKTRVYHSFSNGREIESIVRYVESFIIKNTYAINGYIMLHGGAISLEGKAVVIVGNSFAGKSTAIAYFCSKGFEYLTDDRVLINTNTLEVTPFQRKIMLRPDAVDVLAEKHNISIDTKRFKLENIERNFYTPSLRVRRIPYLKKTILLNRQISGDFCVKSIEYGEATERLLIYGMNVKNYKHIDRYRKIAECGVSEVHYTNLYDLENYIREVLK